MRIKCGCSGSERLRLKLKLRHSRLRGTGRKICNMALAIGRVTRIIVNIGLSFFCLHLYLFCGSLSLC